MVMMKCACTINDAGKVDSLCGAHAQYERDEAQAAAERDRAGVTAHALLVAGYVAASVSALLRDGIIKGGHGIEADTALGTVSFKTDYSAYTITVRSKPNAH
jgi:hypothetical protein